MGTRPSRGSPWPRAVWRRPRADRGPGGRGRRHRDRRAWRWAEYTRCRRTSSGTTMPWPFEERKTFGVATDRAVRVGLGLSLLSIVLTPAPWLLHQWGIKLPKPILIALTASPVAPAQRD